MAKLVYALNASLDGYVDHDNPAFAADPVLFRHFTEDVGSLSGCLYGRVMYGLMRYWDDDQPTWGEAEHAYAAAWRAQPKWVVSSTLKAVGPNATLVEGDLAAAVRALKARVDGVIEVAGPKLANSLGALGLVDEVRMYLHPVAIGAGTPMFTGPWSGLRLVSHEQVGTVARVVWASGV